MGLYGAPTEKFLASNIGKPIRIRIRDVPVDPGILLEYGPGDILIKTKSGARILIDMGTVIGIEEIIEDVICRE